MSFQDWWARLTGQAPPLTSEQLELTRLIEVGDAAKREGNLDAALNSHRKALARAEAIGSLPGQEMIHGLIGDLLTARRQYEEAEVALQAAIALAERIGERTRRARAIGNLGAHYLARGLVVKAQATLDRALEQIRMGTATPDSPEARVMALILANSGAVYLEQNNTAYAIRLLREASALYQAIPSRDIGQFAYATGLLGQATAQGEDSDRAGKLLAQAARLAQQVNDPTQELRWSNALAEVLYKGNAFNEALKLYERCDDLAARVPNPPLDYVRNHLINRANLYRRLGQYDLALNFAGKALTQARTEVDRALEARALSLIADVYKATGRADSAIETIESAIALYQNEHSKHDNAPPEDAHLDALLMLGELYQTKGDLTQSAQAFDQALQLAGSASGGDQLARARVLRRIGVDLNERGETARALERWNEALDLFERAGHSAAAARLLCDIAMAKRQTGGINAALPDYERATMLLNNVRDPSTRGLVLSNVANVYTDLGEVETADAFYREALQLARQMGDRRSESVRLGNYGWFQVATGQSAQAIKLLEEALSISRPIGDSLLIAVQLNNLAQAYYALKDYGTAKGLFEQSLGLIEKADQPRWQAAFRSNLGRVLMAQGQTDQAFDLFNEALVVSRRLNDQENTARTLARLASIYLQRSQLSEADAAAREAEIIARKYGSRKGQADALAVRAGVQRAQGDSGGAEQTLNEAIRLYTILHDPLAAELAPQTV